MLFGYGALLGLFCFRVISQLVQAKFDVPFLPAFDAWHSGTLPYQYLVLAQVLIIVVCGRICLQFTSGKVVAKKRVGMLLFGLGVLYASAMAARLLIGFLYRFVAMVSRVPPPLLSFCARFIFDGGRNIPSQA